MIESEDYRELQMLAELEIDPSINQRQLSARLGIALGLTNILLRNLSKKGYVRASRADWRRWLYALTPSGFSHKMKLTVSYITRVLKHYQNIRQLLRDELALLALHSESRVAICGTGEYAELIYLGLKEIEIDEIEIFDIRNQPEHRFLGLIVQDISAIDINSYDRVMVADLGRAESFRGYLPPSGSDEKKIVTFFSDGKIKEAV